MEAYFVSLISILVMELGDKTQLAVINLSAANKSSLRIFSGAILAFAATNGLAVILGEEALRLIPMTIMRKVSGLLFITLGLYTFLRKPGVEEKLQENHRGAFYAAFASIFLAEIGDKTQLSTILLAAKYDLPLEVLAGSISALALTTGSGVILGTKLAQKLPRNLLEKAAGAIFTVIGILTTLEIV